MIIRGAISKFYKNEEINELDNYNIVVYKGSEGIINIKYVIKNPSAECNSFGGLKFATQEIAQKCLEMYEKENLI